jgi:hypothetical protein
MSKGDNAGGDTSETSPCPLCGEPVLNLRRVSHLQKCDGSGQ